MSDLWGGGQVPHFFESEVAQGDFRHIIKVFAILHFFHENFDLAKKV